MAIYTLYIVLWKPGSVLVLDRWLRRNVRLAEGSARLLIPFIYNINQWACFCFSSIESAAHDAVTLVVSSTDCCSATFRICPRNLVADFSKEPPPSHHLSTGQVGRNAWAEISGRAASNSMWSNLNVTHRLLSQIEKLWNFSSFKHGKKHSREMKQHAFFLFRLQVIKKITGPRSLWAEWP